MELEFRRTQIPYLQCVCHETLIQEEHGETIVPDSMPDMERIVGSCAEAVLRSRACAGGELALAGDVQACVLYRAAGEDEPRQLSVFLPFTLRRAVPEGSCSCAVQCAVKRTEAQMLGSRRVDVRVTLLITLRIWRSREQTCFCPAEPDRLVQLRFAEYPMRLVRECAEKPVLLRDTLPLGAGAPEPARIVFAGGRCELTEEKLSGSQAACKGALRLSLLYQTPEGTLGGCELSMPFSQLIDLEGSYDEQGLELLPVLTSLEVMAEGSGVSVEAGICLQCVVTQTVNVPLVEDAYALRGNLRAETQRLELQPLLDSRTLRQDCLLELPAQAAEILRAEALPDAPRIEWDDGLCRIRVPVAVRVLCRDARGECRLVEGSTELSGELPAARSACQAEARIDGPVFAVPGGGRIELRIPVAAQVRWYDDAPRQSICALELTEGPREERPAVVIRTLAADAQLWDIAKELRTTVSAIQIANDMDADMAPAGTMLLIPIVA